MDERWTSLARAHGFEVPGNEVAGPGSMVKSRRDLVMEFVAPTGAETDVVMRTRIPATALQLAMKCEVVGPGEDPRAGLKTSADNWNLSRNLLGVTEVYKFFTWYHGRVTIRDGFVECCARAAEFRARDGTDLASDGFQTLAEALFLVADAAKHWRPPRPA